MCGVGKPSTTEILRAWYHVQLMLCSLLEVNKNGSHNEAESGKLQAVGCIEPTRAITQEDMVTILRSVRATRAQSLWKHLHQQLQCLRTPSHLNTAVKQRCFASPALGTCLVSSQLSCFRRWCVQRAVIIASINVLYLPELCGLPRRGGWRMEAADRHCHGETLVRRGLTAGNRP